MIEQTAGPPSQDPGFEVAGGDPDQLSAAAIIHADAADMLEMHAGVVAGAASSVDSAWQGQAAGSYQSLSAIVRSRFNLAADGARTAADGLRQWSDELARCQQAGKTAMRECEHWLGQQQHWFFQLQDAERALSNAQAQLTAVSAPNPFTGASPTAPAPGSNPVANPLSPLSSQAIASAQSAVAAAEHDVTVAKGKLKQATEEVLHWQAQGRRAWSDAMTAAETATGILGGIHVTPPPLAGYARGEPTIQRSEPWYDDVLNIAGNVVGGVAAVAGVATALTFWIPGVGEVCATTAADAGATDAVINWVKVAAGDPGSSVATAAVDTVLVLPGAEDLGGVTDEARSDVKNLAQNGLTETMKHADPPDLKDALGGIASGASGAYGAGSTTKGIVHPSSAGSVSPGGEAGKAGAVLAGTASDR